MKVASTLCRLYQSVWRNALTQTPIILANASKSPELRNDGLDSSQLLSPLLEVELVLLLLLLLLALLAALEVVAALPARIALAEEAGAPASSARLASATAVATADFSCSWFSPSLSLWLLL